MEKLKEKLEKYYDDRVPIFNGKYELQVYSNTIKGNVVRFDRTVLVRFREDKKEGNMCFEFRKKDDAEEYGGDVLRVPLKEKLNKVQKLEHEDAEELYIVFKEFMENI